MARVEAIEVKNFHVTGTSETSVTLAWEPSTTSYLDGFKIVSQNATTGASVDSKDVPAPTRQVTISGLQPNTKYRFTIYALQEVSGKKAEATTAKGVEPPPPPPPVEEEPKPEGKEQTFWLPANTTQIPLSDEVAAARVIHKPEVHSDNTKFNLVVPTQTELEAFYKAPEAFNPLNRYVTGGAAKYLKEPSTDDLIQFAAAKWGIPCDWLRAWAVEESNWHHGLGMNLDGTGVGVEGRGFGDFATSNLWSTPTAAVQKGGAFTSLGIGQVKSRPSSDPHPGTKDLRWKSTGFNLDYVAGIFRYYYNGLCTWADSNYQSRFVATKSRTEQNGWEVIGCFEGTPVPWYQGVSVERAEHTKKTLAEKRWAQAGF